MKTFFVALLCFAALLGVIACNTVYIQRSSDRLSDMIALAASEDDPAPTLAALESLWQRERYWIGFSVSFTELCNMDEHLCQMQIALDEGDPTQFKLACGLAAQVVERMGRLERFSWECIF